MHGFHLVYKNKYIILLDIVGPCFLFEKPVSLHIHFHLNCQDKCLILLETYFYEKHVRTHAHLAGKTKVWTRQTVDGGPQHVNRSNSRPQPGSLLIVARSIFTKLPGMGREHP